MLFVFYAPLLIGYFCGMATILTSFSGHPLTSQLGSITAQSNNAKESVTLIRYGSGPNPVFSTTLYPYGGNVILYDIASVIEEDMRKSGVSVGDYILSIGDASIRIQPMYCDYTADGLDADNCFLTTLTSQRVYQDSFFELAAIPNNDTIAMMCLYRRQDGAIDTTTIEIPGPSLERGRVSGSFKAVLANLRQSVGNDVSLLAVTFRNGSRSKTYFMMQGDADARFCFRNCFNAYDIIDLKGVITEKNAVSNKLAICNGRASQYDHQTDQTFEFQSEPLTDIEAQSISQLVASREVYLLHGDSGKRIIITDHTCEIDNDNESLPTVKVSWRHVDSRIHLGHDQIADLITDGGIFTTQFSHPFL